MGRAPTSGRRLSEQDASLVKGMVARGDRHHDIAAWFGVNQGRIAEVIARELFPGARTAAVNELPPPGPYSSGKAAYTAVAALEQSKKALEDALTDIDRALKAIKK